MDKKNNYSKEEINMLSKYSIGKLKKLDAALKKLKNYACRGEINVIDDNNKPIVQTHYEYFIMSLTSELLFIKHNDGLNNIGSLDYTMVDNNKITDYEINKTSIIINGKLDENYRIQIVAVFKNPLENPS
ncbi:hypothetical protein AB8U03_00155 [Clostridium sp. Mt-5]|uniref:YokE-like PH domain-containing protein n=1 Tax=Clostridium moutaii TaxID=3240932 RepID=A0ABV4BJG3_9CLOT